MNTLMDSNNGQETIEAQQGNEKTSSAKMKAAVYEKYGAPDVVQIQDIAKPNPAANEVCIKIKATTVTSGDARLRSFNVPPLVWLPFKLMIGWSKPKNGILGSSFSGEIVSVGSAVKLFNVGDAVFGSSYDKLRCHAEYICLPEDGIFTSKPADMSDAQAAALFFGGHTALHFFNKANIQSGQKVLIYGASGCVGTYAVQLAKYFGAEVTGICSTTNLELVKSLGADKVIDYTKEDFTKNGETYQVIFDTVGKSSFSECIKALDKSGFYLRAVHLQLGVILKGIWVSLTSSKKVIGGVAHERKEELIQLKELVRAGSLKPVIDREYPFEKIAEAHRYVDTERKKGSLVITMD